MNEKALRLLTLFGDVDEQYVSKAEKAPSSPWAKAVLTAVACAAVLAIGVFVWLGRGTTELSVSPTKEPDTAVTQPSSQEQESPSSKVTFIDPLACYAEGPDIGEVFVEYPLSVLELDIEENGKALVDIVLHDENGPVLHSEAVYEELDRLKALGYELYVYEEQGTDYWGAPRHVTHICSYVTLEQLEQFPAGDRFAYWISWYLYSVPIEEYTQY